jgi:hypothetical protein
MMKYIELVVLRRDDPIGHDVYTQPLWNPRCYATSILFQTPFPNSHFLDEFSLISLNSFDAALKTYLLKNPFYSLNELVSGMFLKFLF